MAKEISTDFATVLRKIKTGEPGNFRDMAVAISEDPTGHTLLQFMVDNDYTQVYSLLHHNDNAPMVIGKNAPFTPDKTRVEGELFMLAEKQDFNTLNQIISDFVLNPTTPNYTTNPKLLTSLTGMQSIQGNNAGDKIINLRLS